MTIGLVDSRLFRHQYGAEEMYGIFSEQDRIARYIAIEIALARVQGKLGVIPADAADQIACMSDPAGIDEAVLAAGTDVVGYPILPVVEALARQCGQAGQYVHWGATTQDVMDTALVLQMKDGLDLIEQALNQVCTVLAELADRHRSLSLAGRSHLQHALPVTFGYKAAVWLSGLDRHRRRLHELRPRALVGQFGGAVGTLASLGGRGPDVTTALMDMLGLGQPTISWHVARDGLTETVTLLAMIGGSLAKIAYDVMLMMATEVGEAFEPFQHGRGASSTMPQKRNPISCEAILAIAKLLRAQSGLMLDALIQDHERGTGLCPLEWNAIPESFVLCSGALRQSLDMLEGLELNPAAMARNLEAGGGLIMAEAVMMALAVKIGRNDAHHLVYDLCRVARVKGTSLQNLLLHDERVRAVVGEEDIRAFMDPTSYLGATDSMIDGVLDMHRTINRAASVRPRTE